MDNHLLGRIRARYNTFSSSQQQVADYVLSHADTVMMSSLSDFAKACGVSEPTIMRFLRKLDCDSYQVFRVGIAQELAHGSAENIYEEVSEEDTQAMIRDKVIHHTVRSLEDAKEIIDAAALDHLVEMIRGAGARWSSGSAPPRPSPSIATTNLSDWDSPPSMKTTPI